MAKSSNWAKTAVKHPGAFKSWCNKRGHNGANASCIASGKRSSKPATIRKRAVLADNFRKMRQKKKKR